MSLEKIGIDYEKGDIKEVPVITEEIDKTNGDVILVFGKGEKDANFKKPQTYGTKDSPLD